MQGIISPGDSFNFEKPHDWNRSAQYIYQTKTTSRTDRQKQRREQSVLSMEPLREETVLSPMNLSIKTQELT